MFQRLQLYLAFAVSIRPGISTAGPPALDYQNRPSSPITDASLPHIPTRGTAGRKRSPKRLTQSFTKSSTILQTLSSSRRKTPPKNETKNVAMFWGESKHPREVASLEKKRLWGGFLATRSGKLLPFKYLTWLHVLMSIPLFRYSTTLSRLPARAARRKLALLSDCEKIEKNKNLPLAPA